MTNRRSRQEKDPKGFVLLIVLVVGTAAALAAAALWSTSGHGRLTAMHTDITDRSSMIAEAGMQAAISYLKLHENGNRDFDAILDPDLSCGSLPATPGADDGIPNLGGTNVPDFRSRNWHMVEFNGGGFLVRFEDDADDAWVVGDLWQQMTGNNEDSGGDSASSTAASGCHEGPGAADSLTGHHTKGRDNPLRDRNGSIWVQVIGFYPGNDPAKASHFSTLRRLYSFDVRRTSVPGIRVRGDITVGGSAEVGLCSPIGSIEVAGNVTGSAGCASGDSLANSWGGWHHCAEPGPIDCEKNVSADEGNYTLPGAVPGTLDTPGPTMDAVPSLASQADDLIDWSRPCVFQIAGNNLWFWDANRNVGGSSCGEQAEGSLNSIPVPNPGGSYPGACWSPILQQADGACSAPPFTVSGTTVSEASTSTGACGWAPRGVSATYEQSFIDGLGYPAGTTIVKPNWATECTIDYPPFADTPASLGCTTCGAGNTGNVALHWIGSNPMMFFPVRNQNDAAAVPAGVYLFDTNIVFSGTTNAFARVAHPLADNDPRPMEDYILATIATTGTIDFQNPANPGVGGFFFGSGQNHEGGDSPQYRMPSIIADGNIEVSGKGTMAVAGSMITQSNINYNGTGKMFLFGEAYVNQNMALSGTGEFWWLYTTPLQQTPASNRVFPPLSGPVLR